MRPILPTPRLSTCRSSTEFIVTIPSAIPDVSAYSSAPAELSLTDCRVRDLAERVRCSAPSPCAADRAFARRGWPVQSLSEKLLLILDMTISFKLFTVGTPFKYLTNMFFNTVKDMQSFLTSTTTCPLLFCTRFARRRPVQQRILS